MDSKRNQPRSMAEEPFVQGFRYVPARMYDTLVVVVRYILITDKAGPSISHFFLSLQ